MWFTFHSVGFFNHIQLVIQWRLFKLCFAKSALFLICTQLIIPWGSVLHLSLPNCLLFFPQFFSSAHQGSFQSFLTFLNCFQSFKFFIQRACDPHPGWCCLKTLQLYSFFHLPKSLMKIVHIPSHKNLCNKHPFHFQNRSLIPSFFFSPVVFLSAFDRFI